MHNFIPSTPADKAAMELTEVIKQSQLTEADLAKTIVDNGFGNILQFAEDALERILSHRHTIIDPDEECPFSQRQEVSVYWIESELRKLAKEYTQRKG